MSGYIRYECDLVVSSPTLARFLWVNLQLRHLKFCPPSLIGPSLETLPDGLDDTYADVMRRFLPPQPFIPRVRSVLQCISFAQRSLTVGEVFDILSFDVEAGSFDTDRSASGSRDMEASVLRYLPSLVEIVFSKNQTRVVQFIHFSVKEYFISNARPKAVDPRYSFNRDFADIIITMLCLASLSANNLAPHFRTYAERHWFQHVHRNTSNSIEGFYPEGLCDAVKHDYEKATRVIQSALRKFLSPDSPAFATWDNKKSTVLHWAARLGLSDHTESLLKHLEVDTLDSDNNTPLFCAVENTASVEHFHIIDILLAKGADIKLQPGHRRRSILHRAIDAPLSDEVINFLIERGAVVDAAERGGESALHEAAWRDKVGAVEALIRNGANKDVLDRDGQTPLHRCAWANSQLGARALLKSGAQPNIVDKILGYTPLHHAVYFGHLTILRLLLEDGADAHARSTSQITPGCTALHIAAKEGKMGACEILLEHDTHLINTVDDLGQTPLHYAAKRERHDVAHLLLNYNADANATDTLGRIPLNFAK